MSWPEESNSALWLATRAGKMELSCLLVTMCYVQQEFPWKPCYWPSMFSRDGLIFALFFFCEFMGLSHLDLTLGQWPIFTGYDCMFVLLCNICMYINQLWLNTVLMAFHWFDVSWQFSKKKDIRLGTVSVKGADWNGVMEAAKKTFVVSDNGNLHWTYSVYEAL